MVDNLSKAKAAERWVQAVNLDGRFGVWVYVVVTEPSKLLVEIDALVGRRISSESGLL